MSPQPPCCSNRVAYCAASCRNDVSLFAEISSFVVSGLTMGVDGSAKPGTDCTTMWQFVPPIPNEETPAVRMLLCQSIVSVASLKLESSRPKAGLG
ncbi:hypothetical protein VMB_09910 [Vibrio mimicus VM603]|uniref:Uncharacterized protein n=1 Tax=Vibrio mimicus VM603 TaxID=671074 RepID=D2YBU4_VIBMI|nr:hypothetical protein VMB_09910 [Vibrio mimicus VM603]